ncbi:MAG: hypothetical protein ABI352_01455 [Candidatus Dormibacter sp.]
MLVIRTFARSQEDRIDPPANLLMSNRPFGRFARYVSVGLPVFL